MTAINRGDQVEHMLVQARASGFARIADQGARILRGAECCVFLDVADLCEPGRGHRVLRDWLPNRFVQNEHIMASERTRPLEDRNLFGFDEFCFGDDLANDEIMHYIARLHQDGVRFEIRTVDLRASEGAIFQIGENGERRLLLRWVRKGRPLARFGQIKRILAARQESEQRGEWATRWTIIAMMVAILLYALAMFKGSSGKDGLTGGLVAFLFSSMGLHHFYVDRPKQRLRRQYKKYADTAKLASLI